MRCKHGTYVGDAGGPDYICGACEDGVCQHGKRTSVFQWEDREGCALCGIAPRKATITFEEASRRAQASSIVVHNPGHTDKWYLQELSRYGLGREFLAECRQNYSR